MALYNRRVVSSTAIRWLSTSASSASSESSSSSSGMIISRIRRQSRFRLGRSEAEKVLSKQAEVWKEKKEASLKEWEQRNWDFRLEKLRRQNDEHEARCKRWKDVKERLLYLAAYLPALVSSLFVLLALFRVVFFEK